MSSQKIGPSSLVSRTRCCTGALASSDSMLPTTGFFGGCGIGLSLLVDAIAIVSPAEPCFSHALRSYTVIASEAKQSIVRQAERMDCFVARAPRNDDESPARLSPEPLPAPFDQLGADLVRLFLLCPVAAVANQVFLE